MANVDASIGVNTLSFKIRLVCATPPASIPITARHAASNRVLWQVPEQYPLFC